MIQDRSLDERISTWLVEQAPGELPDWVLRATFELTRPTRQRPPLPWRWSFPTLTHRWILIVLALVVTLAATLLAIGSSLPPPPLPELGRNGLVAFDADFQIYLMNRDGTGRRRISSAPIDFWPIWSPDGTRLLFHRSAPESGLGSNQAVSYWIARADGTGAIDISGVQRIEITSEMLPSWSPSGDSIVFATGSLLDSALSVARTDGQGVRQIVDGELRPLTPTWSPTSATIAFKGGRSSEDSGIYLVNADGSGLRMLTTNTPRLRNDTVPLWSPDGRRLLFTAGDAGAVDLWLINADGSDQHKLAETPFPVDEYMPAWSPDGTRIAYEQTDPVMRSKAVYVVGADGTNPVRVSGNAHISEPLVWSPDGTRILTAGCWDACRDDRELHDILSLDPNGVDPPQRLANEPGLGVILDWQWLDP